MTLNAGDGLLLSAGTNNTLTLSKSNNVFNCSDYDQCYWTLLGNTGTTPPGPQTEFPALTDNWVGTTDRTALELRVNTWRGLRLQPYLPSPVDPINRTVSVIGGYSQNVVDPGVYAATIAGGGSQTGFNTVNGSYGTVGGGSGNTAGTFPGGAYATVAGGANNLASGYISFVAGGNRNSATSKFAAVGGGASNVAEAVFATVAGGLRNTNSGYAAIIGGGDTNRIQANSDSATISGGQWNLIQNAAPFATIGGGRVNKASANAATIGGGAFNTNSGSSSTISGGDFNVIPSGAAFTTVAGGHLNFASGSSATVGGGSFNKAVAPNSTIPGGQQALTGSYGQQAYASGQFANPGDAQSSLLVLRTNTSSTAQSELFLDGGTAGNQRMNVPIGATWTFNILVAARNGAAGGNQSGGWEIRGVVQNIGGTVSLLCSTITTNCATLAGTPFVQALNPQQALVINTKDQTAAPTRWVASVRTAEVIAP